MKITASNLMRWAGLSAMAAGILFIVVQTIHPHEILSSVTTDRWAIVHYLTVIMCIFGLFGITGIYARQLKEAGWLGLVGYLMFSVWLMLAMALTFVEACILPLLTTDAPKFVEGYLRLSTGAASEINLGFLAVAGGLVSAVLYLLGGLLFGIAMFRAGILSRWATAMFAFGAVASLAAAVLPHDLARIAAVPMGLGLAWVGYSLWSERREKASESLTGRENLQLRQTGAK